MYAVKKEVNKEKRRHFFCNRVIDKWNSLPENAVVDNYTKPSILNCKNCIKIQVLVVAIALLKFFTRLPQGKMATFITS